uniref:Uncharacterized protein n=1 Tax=Magallana gigas TaxID=29159 RepID=K1PLV0_MAGGI
MEGSAAAFVDTVLITRHVIILLEFVNRDASPDIKGKFAQKQCHHINGTCMDGCDDRYQGLKCIEEILQILQFKSNSLELREGKPAWFELQVLIIPELVIKMNPQFDFSVPSGDNIYLQCTVSNPESLYHVTNGRIVFMKNGSLLSVGESYTNFSTIWRKLSATGNDSGRYTCVHSGYDYPVSVSVYINVIQPQQKGCKSEQSDGIIWNTTLAGTTKKEPCPENQIGFVTRYCNSDGIWVSPSFLKCMDEALMIASTELDSIIQDGIQNKEKIQETMNNTLQVMQNLTSSKNEINSGDLSSSLDILEKIVNVTNSTQSIIEKKNVPLDIMEGSAAAFVDTVLITRHVIILLEFVNRDASPDIKGKFAQKQCHHINGTCMDGCDDRYQGLKCIEEILQILQFKSNSLELREGKPAWFELQVLSHSDFKVEWFHDGYMITTSRARFIITSTDMRNATSFHTLQIDRVMQRDTGEWKITVSNEVTYVTRKVTVTGFVTRYCNSDGIWVSPSFLKCMDEALMIASTELDSIIQDGIQNKEKIQETMNNTLQVMQNLTSSKNEINSGDLSSSLDILEKIVNVTNSTQSIIEKKSEKDASSLLKTMERLSDIIIKNHNITTTQFSGSNFELKIDKTNIDQREIRFPDTTLMNLSRNLEDTSTFLELPKQGGHAEKAINYVAVIYKTMSDILSSDFHRNDNENEEKASPKKIEYVNSAVLSLTTQDDFGELDPPLNLTFKHVNQIESKRMQVICVPWDFAISYDIDYICPDMEGHSFPDKGSEMVRSKNSKNMCIAITAIIHYLFLVTFFSMLGMGVYYFMSITVTYYAMYVANNFKSKSRVRWFLLLLVVYGKRFPIHVHYSCLFNCRGKINNDTLLLTLSNTYLTMLSHLSSREFSCPLSGLRSLGTLLPVLGVTWLFGILAVNEHVDVFQYIFVIANSCQVMQALRHEYPAFSAFKSITEESKKETTTVATSQLTSNLGSKSLKVKRKGIIERIRALKRGKNKVKDSEVIVLDETLSTDCSTSLSHEKSFKVSENEPTINTLELESARENTDHNVN